MKTIYKNFGIVLLLIMSCGSAMAASDKNEIGLLLGGIRTGQREITSFPGGTADIQTGKTYQVNYGRRFYSGKSTALYWEIHFTGTPSTDIQSTNLSVPRNYASLFLTPGIRVKFLPQSPLSPYLVVGGGYGRFDESDFLITDQPNTGKRGTNTGAFDFGGGADWKVWRFISARGEVRDFISGNPQLHVSLSGSKQHNVLISGGFALGF